MNKIKRSVKNMNKTKREIDALVDLLMELNLKRPIARTLVCLLDGKDYTSHEIERVSGLRQPEVSVAMKFLISKKWVIQKEVKKESTKGRPVKHYRLRMPVIDIINFVEKSIREENDKLLQNIKELKELV